MKRLVVGGLAVACCACAPQAENTLMVYSARNEELIRPVFEFYESQNGVAIDYVTDQAGPLLERLKAEGDRTPADVLLTVDAGNLWHAAEAGLLQPLDSEVLDANIPAHLRDRDDRWFGLSVRARTIVYNTENSGPEELSGYEDLADAAWSGRLCLRTSKKVYNQSLVAMLIAQHGEEEAERIVRGWVDNLATNVFANDTQVLEAVAAGQCDVGIVNTYYYGRLLKDKPNLPIKLFWPDEDTGGVHVNVSGAGVTRYAPHADEAQAFLEWLSSGEAQAMFAGLNLEYPVNPDVEMDPDVADWGQFEASELPLTEAGERQVAAVRLMDRVGYH